MFLEHVRGRGRLAGWQKRLTPLWSTVPPDATPTGTQGRRSPAPGSTSARSSCSSSPNSPVARLLIEGAATRPAGQPGSPLQGQLPVAPETTTGMVSSSTSSAAQSGPAASSSGRSAHAGAWPLSTAGVAEAEPGLEDVEGRSSPIP